MKQPEKYGMIALAAFLLLTGCGRQQDSAETEPNTMDQAAAEVSLEAGANSEAEQSLEAEANSETGTSPERKTSSEAAEGQVSEPTEIHLVQEGDGVMRVDAVAKMPEQGLENVKKLTARCKVWNDADKEQAAKILVPDAAKDAWTIDEQGAWNYQNNAEMVRIDTGIYYIRSTYDKKSYYGPTIIENFPNTYFDQGKDLGFLTVQEAEEQAKEFLKDLGIEQVGIKRIYSVDQEKLNESVAERATEEGNELFAEKTGLDPSDHWTEEDEYYLIEAVTEIDGIEVKEFGYLRDDYTSIPGSLIEIAIGKDGVEYLATNAVYEKLEEETVSLQGPEQILEKVRGKFELLILDFEVLVEEMRLIYYPILENLEEAAATLQPVWEVQIEVEGNHINYYFDGETGKKLVW